MENNRLHLYTGNGKGKTTASMGLALRMISHGGRVLVTQFMKDGTSGGTEVLCTFPNVKLVEGAKMKGFVWKMGEEQPGKGAAGHPGFPSASGRREIKAYEPQLIILDELAVAIATRMISEEDAIRLIDTALSYGETVVTGRYAGEKLIEKADYVSEIRAVNTPLMRGASREGD